MLRRLQAYPWFVPHLLAAVLLYALALYGAVETTDQNTLAELVRAAYLQLPTANSMTIVWRARQPSSGRVLYGPTPLHLDREIIDPAVSRDHSVTIEGLKAATKYFYAIGSDRHLIEGGSESYYFVTSPPPGQPRRFTAWVIGDSGTGEADQLAVRDAMLAFTAAEPPDLILGLGDLAYYWGNDFNFTRKFFDVYRRTLRHTPSLPAMGNHEAKSADSASQSGTYYDAFVLPAAGQAGGVASGTEAYYSYNYANTHFIVLDTADTDLSTGSPMLEWLDRDLGLASSHWLIAYFHHPPYTKGSHDSDSADTSHGRLLFVRENVLRMLEASGVDLVLSGHSHNYERSLLVDRVYCPACNQDSIDRDTLALGELETTGHILDGGSGDPAEDGAYQKAPGRRPHNGTVYVVAGHGGHSTRQEGLHPIMTNTDLSPGSCLLTIDADSLTLVNVSAGGAVSDRFTIIKPSITPSDD